MVREPSHFAPLKAWPRSHCILFNIRRKHRRLANNWLIPRAVSTYAPIMERKSRALIKDMLDEGQQGLLPVSPQVRDIRYLTLSIMLTQPVSCQLLCIQRHGRNHLRHPL